MSNAGLDPASSPARYICYLDSDASGNFSLELAAGELPQTWIANNREFTTWRLVTADPAAPPTYASVVASYLDPCVVPVPESQGGGYLMLLLRKRVFAGQDTLPQDPLPPLASQGLFDIVAYWSDNPEFNDPRAVGRAFPGLPSLRAVHGPAFLVDSLDALPGVDHRVFVGVPTAAFHSSPTTGEVSLYVYYAVDFPDASYLNGEETGYQAAGPASDYGDYFNDKIGFIACKRFDWVTLKQRIRHAPPEAGWTQAIEGDLLGKVNI